MTFPSIRRDTRAEIDLGCIRNNVRQIRSRLPQTTALMAVVKANGYGHGATETAREAIRSGADSLAVAYLDEGIDLRRQGIAVPILILTPIEPRLASLAVRHRLELTVGSADWFERLAACPGFSFKQPLCVHVKLDTGLGRIGIRERSEWERLLPWLRLSSVRVEGVFTHFATAGDPDDGFMRKQAEQFRAMKDWIVNSGIEAGRYHCSNSAAALRYPDVQTDMARIGAALYGLAPRSVAPELRLKPALSLRSRLIHVKKIGRGDRIGYADGYVAREEEWIGTVPIGYADGWSQMMNRTALLAEGEHVPITGKIGMDQLMVRLPREMKVGTTVTLIGRDGGAHISCAELGADLGVAPQEISSSLTSRVQRIYKSQQEDERRRWPVAMC
ncbi:alanine racemase [Cohnella boryungensis]|uniref:Alanine racemase n=1 Tax=Cohnella boryungensis TaxID=768479 RepID=A0ABV8SJR9_9BACL